MTQNTEQNVRTRDEQIGDIANDWIATGMGRNIAYEWASEVVHEAEARGAEEQRRKDAEGQVPIAWLIEDPLKGRPGCAHLIDRASTNRAYAENMETLNFDVSPLYTHPANVAALVARVKELVAENEKFRNAMSAIATHVGGFASPNCSVDFMTSAIPEEVRLSFTTLTREGGV
ncbi:hypothetical protein AD929_15850 [Gluconobacter potus]|uniref:Uncharacterized protein n=1 Tax=Gluconobacter potus TaxID=2724927 RepID=A0A149QPN4_9PROT|nr:hypothetical protein [Gluconobacter potus]KXU99265.1 hypothetical protein AD929_15850 [Gluconobacter potus]